MHCSIRPRRSASPHLTPRWLLAATVSIGAAACSGDVETAGEPQSQNESLEGTGSNGMPNTSAGASTDSTPTGGGDALGEGPPEVTGIDGMDAESDAAASEMAMTPMLPEDVPAGAYCEAAEDWDPEWVQFEEEVLLLVNENRSRTADCGVEGTFAAAPPLAMNPILRCSARLHSFDMFERGYFEHDNPDGINPFQRMAAAGFVGSGGGENIALGQTTPEQVMDAWMDSDGHCANVMRPNFTLIGVGYHPGMGRQSSNYWTQNFGAPARTGTRR